MKYAALLFDLEGTIIDTEAIWDECSTEFLRRRGHTYNPHATKHLMMGGTLEKGAAILRDHYGFAGDAQELAQERREIFGDLLERDIEFVAGFEEFFTTVRDKYPVAIATSMERPFLARVERHLKLSGYFGNHIYSIADIGFVAKPSPDIFLYAASRLSVNPDKCLVFEDAPHGVTAAKAAGMDCVAITTSTTRERLETAGADQIVDLYSEIRLVT